MEASRRAAKDPFGNACYTSPLSSVISWSSGLVHLKTQPAFDFKVALAGSGSKDCGVLCIHGALYVVGPEKRQAVGMCLRSQLGIICSAGLSSVTGKDTGQSRQAWELYCC